MTVKEESSIKKGINKIKDSFRKPKEDKIGAFAKSKAVHSAENYKESDVIGLLANYKYKKIGEGLNSRVFKVENENWVVKESKWDLDFKLFDGGPKIPAVMRVAEFVLGLFSYTFRPTTKHILRDLSHYNEFAQYFGYQKPGENTTEREKLLFSAQDKVRETLLFFKPAIERKYGIKLNGKLEKLLSSDLKYHNFLPNEYQLIGKSISKENEGKVTSFIFQEFVEGKMLADIPDAELSNKHKQQLVLMVYLVLLMHMQIGLLPDTKPRNFMINAYNWLTKTDNIVVHEDKLVFIDTRWFWDTHANYIKRGMAVPEMIVNRAIFSLKDMLKRVEV